MPWLEPNQSRSFHIVFRYLGRRYRRSLKTRDGREAELLAARVEGNLRLIERGRIVVPDDVDRGLLFATTLAALVFGLGVSAATATSAFCWRLI